ncbi:MAG: FAD-dependent oxidoreductase [Candidatus Firestonebacteria bacterium]
MKKTVILGAGLSGLSTAYHLQKYNQEYSLYEKDDKVGGLSKSIRIKDFSFDWTGHFLHFKNDHVKSLVFKLLKGNMKEIKRKSAVYISNQYINYPFQANFTQLNNEKIIKECEEGLLKIKRLKGYKNFKEWIYGNYGDGVAKYFMIPYNKKLWRFPLNKILPTGTTRYIPDTSKESKKSRKSYGYNILFYYPAKGGIGCLADSLAKGLKNTCLNKDISNINAEKKTIKTKNRIMDNYDYLVSTIPLPELINMIKDVPSKVKKAAGSLRSVSLFGLNLGINRPNISPYHWIYFPEHKFIFYRAGFYSNISSDLNPTGTSSLYVEVSLKPDEKMSKQRLIGKIKEDLLKANILKKSDKILVENSIEIKYAYVVFDLNYNKNLKLIMDFLKEKNIYSIGRYGRWTYSSMEDAILDGKVVAEEIKGISIF